MLHIKQFKYYLILFTLVLLSACNVTKHVADGEYLLDKCNIHPDVNEIPQNELKDYLRQTPNSKVFGFFRMQLDIYNLAGKDTSSRWNKSLMRMGSAPVIYDQRLTNISAQQLQKLYVNKGYMNATVESNVTVKEKKATVDYYIKTNQPYTLHKYKVDLYHPLLTQIANDTSRSLVKENMLFDVDVLDAERQRISNQFRELGYYNFSKEYLVYTADSSLNDHKVDVDLGLRSYLKTGDSINALIFKQYKIGRVIYYANTNANQATVLDSSSRLDTIQFRDFYLIRPEKKFISLDALVHNTYIDPNTLFSDKAVEDTYSALNSLAPIKYVNISFKENGDSLLDCYVIIIPAKTISVSSEIEGTYTDGYWGGAAKVGAVNKNIFKGAESLTFQSRLAYEWQQGIWARELGGQVGLKFPKFLFPVGSFDFKRGMHANTEFTTDLSYQLRPSEFTASNVGAGMNYSWLQSKYRHRFELFNLSYMDFELAPNFMTKYILTGRYNSYNYVSRFILRMGYNGSYSGYNPSRPLRDYSTWRYSMETAGNLLYGLNSLLNTEPSPDGTYKIFGIRYSQYVRGEYNISYHQIFDKNNRFVYHVGMGLGIPYGNADLIPYERRFYAGGANSVRGWSESKLGPGVYVRNNVARDYNQVGDLKLDLNMEYRVKLFYVFEGALFVDGGNIWTIKDYVEQPGGVWKYDTFLSQIAIAYGGGIRMDFSFFIARLDMGIRLYDPMLQGTDRWRMNTTWEGFKNDVAFHIAIGYPF